MNKLLLTTPVGVLRVRLDDGGAVVAIEFEGDFEIGREPSLIFTKAELAVAIRITGGIRVAHALKAYFKDGARAFDVPLAPVGTPFQLSVWEALKTIPYGETRSYGEIASLLGNPKGSRAVGMANGRNPIPIIVPCHRVIGSNGTLTGFGGGLDRKRVLLDLERRIWRK